MPKDKSKEAVKSTHIYILLDRSGSMSSIASDVVGGLNKYISDQQKNGPDAKVTFVQFDSQDRKR